ncbi:antitoxin MazE-like protein [Ventosimonas gracilis]|nr:antitoxin MazE-like protein [Ventosimonas gracilis]
MNPVNSPLQKHPDALRRAGLRPLQIRVPDSRQQGKVKH